MSDKPQRRPDGTIVPGTGSLNPGPKHTPEPFQLTFVRRCRRVADLNVVDAWEQEVLKRGPHWIKASALLAAYGYGLPKQRLTVEDERKANNQLSELSKDELRALARRALSTEQRDSGDKPANTEH